MFDPDLIDSLTPEARNIVAGAVMALRSTGILQKQKERLFSRALEGADSESLDSLSMKILDYRRASHALEDLIQLGEQFMQELRNDEQSP